MLCTRTELGEDSEVPVATDSNWEVGGRQLIAVPRWPGLGDR